MKYWKVNCTEDWYPGLWRRWFYSQAVAVGWPPPYFRLVGPSKHKNWSQARNCLNAMRPGDQIVVQLRGHRIARVCKIVRVLSKDEDWNAFVPVDDDHDRGEMGRRIEVRGDLNLGPRDTDTVVELPEHSRLDRAILRPTVAALAKRDFRRIESAMTDESNWVNLVAQCGREVLLSDYITTVPHHIEDGMQLHPSLKVRERVFKDRSGHHRSDVLLVDKNQTPVVVECKRDTPDAGSVRQLLRYLHLARKETGRNPRGILVHGGATKLTKDLRNELSRVRRTFPIEVLRYELSVGFTASK